MQEQIHDFVATLAESRGASENTQGAYRTDLRQLLDYLARRGVSRWDAVSEQQLDGFLEHLAEREYAPTSVARKVAAIRSYFVYLVESGVAPSNPALRLRSPRITRFIPPNVSPAAAARLSAQPRSSTPMGLRDTAMLALLQTTGMRVSEIVNLNLGDLTPGLVSVRCRGRGGRERELPLPTLTQARLRAYLERGRPAHAARGEHGALFLNHHGARLTRQGFWLIMKAHARAVGIADISPHSLRHAFALELIEQGLELRAVQERLGHANLATTQIYRQAFDARAEQADTAAPDADLVPSGAAVREPATCEGGQR
ncbi:MAG TPA: tyrosine-type recombinase/integrase [Ktedonobacterales bacterium]|nr:tyrosine-type recombinase/integrase [Ktedonobacterales bacterium]